MNTAILKIDAGARDQILHCSGNEHSTRRNLPHNSRTDVNRDRADIVAHQFTNLRIFMRKFR